MNATSATSATSRLTFTPGGHIYKLDGHKVPSVTTCLKVLGGCDALIYWAANTAADYATDNWDQLAQLPPSQRRDRIAKAHRTQRDKAAATGTQIHAWAEELLAGRPVEIPDHHRDRVQAFANWWERSGFTEVLTETCVYSTESFDGGTAYAGTFDCLATHPRWGTTLLDWKTGKGVYLDMAVQLAGYASAEWHQTPDGDRAKPSIDTLAVVHIPPDGPTLHTLDKEQQDNAHEWWALVRHLNTTPAPAFHQEAQ